MIDDLFIGNAADPYSMKEAYEGIDIEFTCMGLAKSQHGLTGEQVDQFGNKAVPDAMRQHVVRKFICISVFNTGKMMRTK
jgi:hypothetical protein